MGRVTGKSANRGLPVLDLPGGSAASRDDVTLVPRVFVRRVKKAKGLGLGSRMRGTRLVLSFAE